MNTERSGFSDVDGSADPESLVRFLDERGASSFFIDNRRQRLDRLCIQHGDAVLEVGCGTGDFTHNLQSAAGQSGVVVGIDLSSTMVTTARNRSEGGAATPRFCVADATRLPFADATFDACTAERVLFHLEQPERAVAEVARVVRPGARVALFEPDWRTMTINAPDRELTEKIVDLYVRRLASPGAAGALPQMLRAAGFEEIDEMPAEHVRTERSEGGSGLRSTLAGAVRSGALSREQVTAWGASVREAAAAGRYSFSLTFALVSARKAGRG
jgi:ubiquinone/menaquinone biosynthesis C-methylase UbiE